MSEQVPKRLYSVKEAGIYLGRSAWAVRHLIWSSLLKAVRQGRRVMVDKVDMDEFIEKHKQEVNDGHDLPSEEEGPGNGTVG